MAIVVGLVGYAQHGKDTVANYLVQNGNFLKMAFADKLREFALACDPFVRIEHSIYMQHTANPICYSWSNGENGGLYTFTRLSVLIKEVGWDRAKKHPDVRRFLQRIGTEGARDCFGNTFWIDQAHRTIEGHREQGWVNFALADCRFPNEEEAIHEWGGLCIRVQRFNQDGSPFDNGIGSDHPSEASIKDLRCDYTINNVTGDFDGLMGQIIHVFAQIREGLGE